MCVISCSFNIAPLSHFINNVQPQKFTKEFHENVSSLMSKKLCWRTSSCVRLLTEIVNESFTETH